MALTKILNDENKSFQPVLTDKLVYDTKPTVNSFNGITSDAVARAIAGASGEVPAVTESDNGKILTAIYDEGGAAVEWADAPSGIPDMTSQDGKILGAVNNGGTMEAQWINKPVSNVTTSDKQFVVGVNGSGLPITVDCSNAYEVKSIVSLGTGGYMELDGRFYHSNPLYPSVVYPYDLSSIPSGASIQFTVVIPNTIDCSDINALGLDAHPRIYTYSIDGTHADSQLATSPDGMVSGKVINAGTYVFVTSSTDLITTDTGFALVFPGGGSPEDWATFCGRIESAASSISCSISVPSNYNIKPSVIATANSGDAGKVLTVTDTQGHYGWSAVPTELPTVTGNAGKVLTVNSGATGVEWAAPAEYTMVYNTTPAGGSMDGTPWQAVQAGKRIGVVVPYSAFSGSLAAGSLYSTGKIYMPLASVVDRGSGEYKWNFYLYDGANKWSLALTCEEDEWSWGTPSVVPG